MMVPAKQELGDQIRGLLERNAALPVAHAFESRLMEAGLTRDDNPSSHFCVYFAAYDPASKQVFIGHHKKSGLWLFNGGHIELGETLEDALQRETAEEWGISIRLDGVGEPKLLTVTDIDNPARQTCMRHFDIWYFIPVDRKTFCPQPDLLETEFFQTAWLRIEAAQALVTDPNTLSALALIQNLPGS